MTPQYCNHNAVFDCSDETGRKWRDGQEGKERLLDQVKWLNEQQLFFISFEVAWNLGRLESQDGETAVNQAAQEIAPVGQFVGLFCYWLDKVLRRKTAVLLDFVQITSPPPPIWTTCTTFFRRQNSRFESQFRTKNTMYTL